MQTDRPFSPFEVSCPRCRVTFPVETRRCVHCGGPTGPSAPGAAAIPMRLGRATATPAPPAGEEDAEAPETLVRPRAFSPLTLLWIALIVGGYAMRACSGH